MVGEFLAGWLGLPHVAQMWLVGLVLVLVMLAVVNYTLAMRGARRR